MHRLQDSEPVRPSLPPTGWWREEGREVARALDVAAYILEKQGCIDAMKLQKLLYYVQAWSLAWRDEPLFVERIEAWVHGPVVPYVWTRHKGLRQVSAEDLEGGDAKALHPEEREIIDAVLEHYGRHDGRELRRMTHMDEPWVKARGMLPDDTPSNAEISHDEMKTYYRRRIPEIIRSESGGSFYLECLLSQVTDENRHGEISLGPAVGREWPWED